MNLFYKILSTISLLSFMAGNVASQNFNYYPIDHVPQLQVSKFGYEHDSLSWMIDYYSTSPTQLTVSTDNWKTWNTLYLLLDQFKVASKDTIYLVKDGIYRTANFGESWDLLTGTGKIFEKRTDQILDMEYFQGVFLATYYDRVDEMLKVLYSENGGDSFTAIDVKPMSYNNYKFNILAESKSKWWIYRQGAGIVKYTDDAGQTWKEIPYSLTGDQLHLLEENTLIYTNKQNQNKASISYDGGLSWKELNNVLFPLTDSIYVQSYQSKRINYTTDQGEINGKFYDLYPQDWFGEIKGMYMLTSGDIYAVLENGQVIVSDDTMKTFSAVTEVNTLTGFQKHNSFALAKKGASPAYSGLYFSEDNGDNWHKMPIPTADPNRFEYILHAPDSIIVSCFEDFGNYIEFQVYATSDTGKTYQQVVALPYKTNFKYFGLVQNQDNSFMYKPEQDSIYVMFDNTYMGLILPGTTLEEYHFFDKSNGLVTFQPNNLSEQRKILVTNDMGQSWDTSFVNLPINSMNYEILMTSTGSIFIQHDAIGWLGTYDNGATWDTVFTTGDNRFIERSRIIETGTDTLLMYREDYPSKVYSSINGGHNWTLNESWAVNYLAQQTSVGHFGEIYYTTWQRAYVNEESCPETSTVDIYEEGDNLFVSGNFKFVYWESLDFVDSLEVNRLKTKIPVNNQGSYVVYVVDIANCVYSGDIYKKLLPVKNDNTFEISIFPVPSFNGHISIIPEHEAQFKELEIYSLSGKLVTKLNPSNIRHNLSSLENGTYILKIKTTEGQFSKRILIAH